MGNGEGITSKTEYFIVWIVNAGEGKGQSEYGLYTFYSIQNPKSKQNMVTDIVIISHS